MHCVRWCAHQHAVRAYRVWTFAYFTNALIWLWHGWHGCLGWCSCLLPVSRGLPRVVWGAYWLLLSPSWVSVLGVGSSGCASVWVVVAMHNRMHFQFFSGLRVFAWDCGGKDEASSSMLQERIVFWCFIRMQHCSCRTRLCMRGGAFRCVSVCVCVCVLLCVCVRISFLGASVCVLEYVCLFVRGCLFAAYNKDGMICFCGFTFVFFILSSLLPSFVSIKHLLFVVVCFF